MTREEAIEIINRENDPNDKKVWELFPEYREALEMAIQALEQEPCDDAVSRVAVCEIISDIRDCISVEGYCAIIERLKKLPPVTPPQKYGKWIDYSDEGFVECPFCGHATNCEDNIDELHYCFYCGAKMVEPQESEDKE